MSFWIKIILDIKPSSYYGEKFLREIWNLVNLRSGNWLKISDCNDGGLPWTRSVIPMPGPTFPKFSTGYVTVTKPWSSPANKTLRWSFFRWRSMTFWWKKQNRSKRYPGLQKMTSKRPRRHQPRCHPMMCPSLPETQINCLLMITIKIF